MPGINDVADEARKKANDWAVFGKPVLAKMLLRCADEIERLEAACDGYAEEIKYAGDRD